MVLFWATVPLMALAVLWAFGVVALRSVREERRQRAYDLATGQAEAPEDDATRMVVRAKPASEQRTKHVVDEELRTGQGADELRQAEVTPTPNDRHVVVSVPGDAQPPTIERVVNRLNEDESVEDVQVIPPRTPSDVGPT